MRKKINVQDLKKGMYVDEFCGSWMDHPFESTSFLLNEDNDLRAIRNSSLREVWIDTSKGKDTITDNLTESARGSEINIEEVLRKASSHKITNKIALKDELDNAKKVLSRAKKETTRMFQEARMGKALDTKQASSLVNDISESVINNQGALISLARLKNKDNYTYLHSVAVCALMIALGRQFGFEGELLHNLGMAGMLHDLGKMFIPDEILNKPGKLTDEEFDIIKSHPTQGWENLKDSPDINDIILDVCRHHHERPDGRGYPDSLSDADISLFAKMGAVCDVYDAITSTRAYKPGWEPAVSVRKMTEWKDGQFDEHIFNAFIKTVGIYPVGTLVKLQSGRLAVVTEQNSKNLLTPEVKAFYSTSSGAHIPHKIINLATSQDGIVQVENPATWGLDLAEINGF